MKQLLLFAREAEANKDYNLASVFYKQVREPHFFPAITCVGWHSTAPQWGHCSQLSQPQL